jgi:hypothetical protein
MARTGKTKREIIFSRWISLSCQEDFSQLAGTSSTNPSVLLSTFPRNVKAVVVVARPGWHYETEEDAIADVEALIDQQL